MSSVLWWLGVCLPFLLAVSAPSENVGLGLVNVARVCAATSVSMPTSRSAETLPAATAPASLRRIETIEHDFGKVWAGDSIKHTFEIQNTRDRVLAITGVSTGCGCTATSNWEKQVQPGGVWKLDAVFTTTGRRGSTTKSITVTTDDPDRPEIHLVMKGLRASLPGIPSPLVDAWGFLGRRHCPLRQIERPSGAAGGPSLELAGLRLSPQQAVVSLRPFVLGPGVIRPGPAGRRPGRRPV